jgi:hypothetical protein
VAALHAAHHTSDTRANMGHGIYGVVPRAKALWGLDHLKFDMAAADIIRIRSKKRAAPQRAAGFAAGVVCVCVGVVCGVGVLVLECWVLVLVLVLVLGVGVGDVGVGCVTTTCNKRSEERGQAEAEARASRPVLGQVSRPT